MLSPGRAARVVGMSIVDEGELVEAAVDSLEVYIASRAQVRDCEFIDRVRYTSDGHLYADIIDDTTGCHTRWAESIDPEELDEVAPGWEESALLV